MHLFISNFNSLKRVYFEKDISFLVLVLSVFLLPFSVNLSTFTLISAIVLKILQTVFLKQKLFISKPLKYSSALGLVFFIYIIISSLIQNGVSGTFGVFEKQFSHWVLLFLIPILFRKKEDNLILCYALFLGVIITCVYVFVMSFILNIEFNNEAFIKVVDIHHTYLSMFLLFFVNTLLVKHISNHNRDKILAFLLVISLIVFAFTVIFILKSKVSIVIFSILLLLNFVATISKNNILGYIIVFSVLIACGFVFNKKLNVSYEHALDFRLSIWNESLSLIKDNPVFGSLKANEKDLLNYKHYISGKYYFMDSDLNSHNQYFSIAVKYGFVGIMILLFFVFNVFRTISNKTQKSVLKELIGFTLIIAFIFYIENVLDRHHGIVFFTIFYNYFLVALQDENV